MPEIPAFIVPCALDLTSLDFTVTLCGRFGVGENQSPASEAQKLTNKGGKWERTVVIEIDMVVASRRDKKHPL